MNDLSSEIYVSEHRNRYQSEQLERLSNSTNYFNRSLYSLKTCTVADFIEDYNKFLWNSIKKSHFGISHKIQASVQGNYNSSNSRYDKLFYHLYFQGCNYRKLIAKILSSAYIDPRKSSRDKYI